jgi:hypothetical protein
MNETTWDRIRLKAYAGVGTALIVVGAVVKFLEVDQAEVPLLTLFGVLASLMVLLVIIDTVYHSWRNQGQACSHCGHLRKMKPFRVYGPCPSCGE